MSARTAPRTGAIEVRDSEDADLPAITAIYADAVLTGTATFEIEPPSEADMTQRLLTEARVEAKRSLLALDSALAKDGALLNAEERAAIDAGRNRLEGAMAGESRDEINAAAEELETLSKPFAERRMDRGIREALSGLSVKELETRVGE